MHIVVGAWAYPLSAVHTIQGRSHTSFHFVFLDINEIKQSCLLLDARIAQKHTVKNLKVKFWLIRIINHWINSFVSNNQAILRCFTSISEDSVHIKYLIDHLIDHFWNPFLQWLFLITSQSFIKVSSPRWNIVFKYLSWPTPWSYLYEISLHRNVTRKQKLGTTWWSNIPANILLCALGWNNGENRKPIIWMGDDSMLPFLVYWCL